MQTWWHWLIDGAAAFADEIIDAAKMTKRVAAKRAVKFIDDLPIINGKVLGKISIDDFKAIRRLLINES